MAKPPKLYQRLTRMRAGLGSYSSLWMAADHLMVVTSMGFNESYRRFYFRDIQAFFVIKSSRYFFFNLVAGLIALVTGAWMVNAMVQAGGWKVDFVGMLFLVVPSWMVLIVNLVKGPSCRVMVITALQKTELKPLSRRRKARQVMAKIEPLIRAAQLDQHSASAASVPSSGPIPADGITPTEDSAPPPLSNP